MKQLNLENYEISPVEPLHDIKGHIKNIWDILPVVLQKETKKLFANALKTCFGNKWKIRGCDYRLSVLIIYSHLKQVLTEDIRYLLITLVEISFYAYKKANERTPKSLLRLFNVSFTHGLLCKSIFGHITDPKYSSFFGTYFHSIVTHLPEIARIIAPSSLHSESEERMFSDLNSIGLAASSRKCECIIDNCISPWDKTLIFQIWNKIGD